MDTPTDFWAWFGRTVLPVLARAEVPPAPLIDELDGRIARVGCAWELGPAPEGRPGWAFAVSFGADLDRLPAAEAVVRCAPPMASCVVLLGKPPKQWDGTLKVRSGDEPSGAHGLIDSADPTTDFATLHDYIIARAGAPTPVTGPLNFRTSSTVPSLTYASYSFVLCDFWLDSTDDPGLYSISSGAVDDGILVIVNGEILGNLLLGETGSWPLTNAHAGEVNSLVVILMDNAQTDKYLVDLAFYRDGVMVGG